MNNNFSICKNLVLFSVLSLITFVSCSVSEPGNQKTQDNGGISSRIVYVSINNGNDANDGLSTSTPVKTIQRAIDIVKSIQQTNNSSLSIYVEDGSFITNLINANNTGLTINGLSNLTIAGGYNNSFTEIIGKTILDMNYITNVIRIMNCYNLKIMNFVVKKGYSPSEGGGIFISNMVSSILSNLDVISNFTSTNEQGKGGGIFVISSSENVFDCFIAENKAKWGGGILFNGCSGNTIRGIILSNSALGDDGGGTNNLIGAGGGITLDFSTNNFLSAEIAFNKSRWGGGMALYYSYNNTINCSVLSNKSIETAGGISVGEGACRNTIDGLISYNESDCGGGLLFFKSLSNTLTATVFANRALSWGDGVEYAHARDEIVSNAVICNNGSASKSELVIYYSKYFSPYPTSYKIINSYITNNVNAIEIVGNLTNLNLVISNCTIGVSVNEGNGIKTFSFDDLPLTNYILKNNKFLTNNMIYLLYNHNDTYSVSNNGGLLWTNINVPTITLATKDSTNNTVQ